MQMDLRFCCTLNCEGGDLELPMSSCFLCVAPMHRFVMCHRFRIEHSGMYHGLLLPCFYRVHVQMELKRTGLLCKL